MAQQTSLTPKSVAFELLFPESPQIRARLPMRVQIFPHDSTESIISTVKNFYGLYAGPNGLAQGVSFEDPQGNTLIPKYENLTNNSIVYVRVLGESFNSPSMYGPPSYHSAALREPIYPADEDHVLPQALTYGQPPSRPTSRTSRRHSPSPSGRGRRSTSVSTNPLPAKKSRSRSAYKNRAAAAANGDLNSDGLNGYSSGDGAPGSVSSRSRSDYLGTTEISLDNIVEGGRRKRAKFESSELPLFAPPQMPAAASNSSVSPARRMEQRPSISFPHPANPYTHGTMQSPPSYDGFAYASYSTPASNRRTRGGTSYPQSTGATPMTGSGILPTPDPTVGSCMSEEDKDVALQLMRLGDMSNISHGRTSASTLDDTFSGRAEASSSTGATDDESESEAELPPARRPRLDSPRDGQVKRFAKRLDDILPSQESTEFSGDEADDDDGRDTEFQPAAQESVADLELKACLKAKSETPIKPRANVISKPKTKMPRPVVPPKPKTKAINGTGQKTPISPTSLPPQSRKASISSAVTFPPPPLGDDTEDLSTKPRCQRCRKSKKGCDRQRPCGRCRDAGLSADQCISEDESNGRKGRYGRHMGVPVKKDASALTPAPAFIPPTAIPALVATLGSPDKSKKRKR